MGEHRVTIRIIFEMHGHKADSGEMYLNGSRDECVPRTVMDWLWEQHTTAMALYDEAQDMAQAEKTRAMVEKAERAELARLKAKYEAE